MLHIPGELDERVAADLLFNKIAVRVVAVALVFKDF
jgi:hypothetical protein